ncbi:inter-alpha-trypsin inhibitor heavy chain H3-like [Antedon mediterranea]|uniref:inter-alpha-trypsin inhibitor heavy chain H3-like n=1 Tax=Antedon mediterranea TaxID=105859 RepID=UPI003AF6EEC1
MGRLSLLTLACMVTWVCFVVTKHSNATPLAVIVPVTNFEGDTHIDEEDLNLERGERDVGSGDEPKPEKNRLRKPEISKLQIRGRVTSRFSSTTVTSVLRNRADEAAEAVFVIRLPEEAFIANFSMEIDGVVYPANIEEKEKAQKIYDDARDRGQSAGQVKQTSEKVNSFKVSVSVAKKTFVTFELIYQEMLTRKNGYFEHRTSIRPGQIVKTIDMQVAILESQGLTEVNTSWVGDGNKNDVITIHDVGEIKLKGKDTRCFISYEPTADEQREDSEDGLEGDFVIRYDVDHPKSGGELQIVNGYFVHYFSPEGLPVVRKNVVFVIDVSGSMNGRKIQQTKEAMYTILDDMREVDFFNIVTFTDITTTWKNTLQQATYTNIQRAKKFVKSLTALYGTNLNEGLIDGIQLLQRLTENTEDSIHGVSMVIMLTDGQPTNGETRLNVIEKNVEQAIDGKYSLFNLGFGDNVDFTFLEKLALRNRGLARKIYDDSKASVQLEGFFDEVATPLLYNVVFNYPEEIVEINSLSQTTFPNYFKGTELVVTGKIKKSHMSNEVLEMTIGANSVETAIEFPLSVETEVVPELLLHKYAVDDFAQRLWAYLSIKDMLQRRSISNNVTEKDELKEKALQLSLEYHFVTPLTSLVVVKPDEDKKEYVQDEINSLSEEREVQPSQSGGSFARMASQIQASPVRGPGRPSSQNLAKRKQSDGDPHFMVNVPQSDLYVCFNIMGSFGETYRLIHDPENGITVTGNIIEEPFVRPGKLKKRSYFGEVTFEIGKKTITVNPSEIIFDGIHEFSWDYDVSIGSPDLSLSIEDHRFTRIYVCENITLVALRHAVTGENIMKVGYMGVYIENGQGLSSKVHGLIGQFQDKEMLVENESIRVNEDFEVHATLKVESRQVTVTKQYRMVPALAQKQPCWFAGDNAAGLIDGHHTDYLQKQI